MALVLSGSWKEFAKALDPALYSKKLATNIAYANRLNGAIMQRKIRATIRSGVPPPNAALTIMIKGSTKPLVDRGQLFQAVASQTVDKLTTFVGVLATSDIYNVAQSIHDGATIKVTEAMRGLFVVLWKASIGIINPNTLTGRARELWDRSPGGWYKLRDETMVINIPPRPFVRIAFEDAATRAKIQSNWEDAVQKSLKVDG